MSVQSDQDNPYLTGNFAPVLEERTVDHVLEVEGAIPPTLEGLLVRNGPNPVSPSDPYHWFSGDGMVHGIELRGGQAIAYRNRWVRTRKLAKQLGTPPPSGPVEPIDGPANTHAVWHAGRLLALLESGFPHRLSTDLDTLEIEDFDGGLTSPMTAHPHIDPVTGGMAFFGYDVFGPPFLRYHEADAAGSIVHSTAVEVPAATMQHDFGVTASRVAFLDLPVVFDADQAAAGSPIPFSWSPDAGARVGILDRGDDGSATRWAALEPCYAFHVMNAFDDGPVVVLDLCRYDTMFDTAPGGLISSTRSRLERWRVDPLAQKVTTTVTDDRYIEFPRIDETLAGRSYRYGYCVEMARHSRADSFDALIRYDLARDLSARWDPGVGRSPGEPVFVRDLDGRADDEGWVLSIVYDAGSDRSDLVILDGSSFGREPEAVVHLPARVPFGFHGSWIPLAEFR